MAIQRKRGLRKNFCIVRQSQEGRNIDTNTLYRENREFTIRIERQIFCQKKLLLTNYLLGVILTGMSYFRLKSAKTSAAGRVFPAFTSPYPRRTPSTASAKSWRWH